MKKVFFVSYGGGHANIVQLVYKALQADKSIDAKVLGLTVSGQIFNNNNVPYVTISSYMHLFQDETILKYGKALAENNYNPNSGILYEDITAYLGLSFYDLVNEYGYKEALKKYEKQGRQVFVPVPTLEKILEYEKPNLVVVTCGVRMEAAAGIAANQLGIPVLRILDLPEVMDIPYQCTLATMNEYSKKVMKTRSFDIHDIVVTGQPVFENNVELDSELRKVYREKYRAEANKQIIVYLEQPGNAETLIIEDELSEIAKKHPEKLFIFKLHPNQELVERFTTIPNIVYAKSEPLKYILDVCDVAITKFSTSGLEAALMDKPLITIVGEHEEVEPDYNKYGIAAKVAKLEQLEGTILTLLDKNSDKYKVLQEGRKEFSNKPNAAANIYALIKKMTE